MLYYIGFFLKIVLLAIKFQSAYRRAQNVPSLYSVTYDYSIFNINDEDSDQCFWDVKHKRLSFLYGN